jgi:hypothetical protein
MSKKKDKARALSLDLSGSKFIPRSLRRLAGLGNIIHDLKEIKEEAMADAQPSIGKKCYFCEKILDKKDESACRGLMARNAFKTTKIQRRLTDLFPTKQDQRDAFLCPECFKKQVLEKL